MILKWKFWRVVRPDLVLGGRVVGPQLMIVTWLGPPWLVRKWTLDFLMEIIGGYHPSFSVLYGWISSFLLRSLRQNIILPLPYSTVRQDIILPQMSPRDDIILPQMSPKGWYHPFSPLERRISSFLTRPLREWICLSVWVFWQPLLYYCLISFRYNPRDHYYLNHSASSLLRRFEANHLNTVFYKCDHFVS